MHHVIWKDGKYFPYGQERPSATTDGKEKFATYFRDSETGLDYANNRYHQPGMGRFMSPDPYTASGGPSDPGSWNRYAYTRGDPVNRTDPGGTEDCNPEAPDCYCQIYGDPNGPYGYDPICDPFYCPPGICDGGGGGGGGLPTCSQFKTGMEWTDTQLFDFFTITKDYLSLGVNLSGFTVGGPTGMQIAGGQGPIPGIPGEMTELVATGNDAGLATFLNSICQTSGYDPSKPNCFAAGGFDLLHAGSPDNQINFRQNTATNSMQITGTRGADGVWTLNIDVDPNNPMATPRGFFRHGGNVLLDKFTGRDTDYRKVASDLGINPYKDNGYCKP